MPIYIAKDINKFPISIVFATDLFIAQAYWQGARIQPQDIVETTESLLENRSSGVIPLLDTYVENLCVFGQNYRDYVVVCKCRI